WSARLPHGESDSLAQIFPPLATAPRPDTSLFEIHAPLGKLPDLRTSGNASADLLASSLHRFIALSLHHFIASSLHRFIASLILFNNLLQFLRHFRDGIESHFHLAIVAAPNDRVHVSELWIFVWKIFAELRSPALFSLNRGTRYRFGNS